MRCRCGDSEIPHVNHRVRVPCWTYLGTQRFDVNKHGQVIDYMPDSPPHPPGLSPRMSPARPRTR